MRTTIKFKNGTADIEIGNSYIYGDYVASPSGQYFMTCGTLCVPSGNDKEYAFVFTKDEVCYKKQIPNDAAGESFYVFDDGQSLILTDESTLIRLDATGKQISKRTVPELDTNGIIESVFYGIGSDDEGLTLLFLYDLDSGRSVTRTIPDIEFDDDDTEDLLSSDVEWSLIGEKFVFVYENGVDAVALDLKGNPVECLQSDIDAVMPKEPARGEESLSKDDGNAYQAQINTENETEPTKQKKKLPVWLIVIIAVFYILMLLLIIKFGKFE